MKPNSSGAVMFLAVICVGIIVMLMWGVGERVIKEHHKVLDRIEKIESCLDLVKQEAFYYGVDIQWRDNEQED